MSQTMGATTRPMPPSLMSRLQGCGRKGMMPVNLSKPLLKAMFLFACSSLLMLSPLSLRAQLPKGDVYLGYSRTGTDMFYPNVGGLNGWEGAMHVKLHKPFIGIEGDVSQYGFGANSAVPRTTTFIFGPRITIGALGPKVFGHALVGGEHSANSGGPTPISSTALAYALGGGLDLPFAPFFAWRVAGDYLRAVGPSPPGGTPARFSTGIVFRF
jgi:hypothetical protein